MIKTESENNGDDLIGASESIKVDSLMVVLEKTNLDATKHKSLAAIFSSVKQ